MIWVCFANLPCATRPNQRACKLTSFKQTGALFRFVLRCSAASTGFEYFAPLIVGFVIYPFVAAEHRKDFKNYVHGCLSAASFRERLES